MPIPSAFARRIDPLMPDLVAAYGTPFHIYDERGILDTHRSIAAAFGNWPFRQFFAVKALPNPAVLRFLLRAGSGLDCSSVAELRLAHASGASDRDVVFTSNNTSQEEYDEAYEAGALITFDDHRHMQRARQLPEIVAFRIAPHGTAARSKLMGKVDSKFGVPLDRLADAYGDARRRGASRFGIHGMSCANELEAGNALRAAEDLIAAAVEVERVLGLEFEYLNFGGGTGIPYRPGDRPFDFQAYASGICDALGAAFPGRRPRILMECGRCVTGPHGILVSRVINRVRKGREIAGVDASMSALMRPGFYRNAYHHITLPFAGERPDAVVDVVGSLCENVDRFAVERRLPDPREGDILYIHDTGAHGHAMGFTYNGRLRPPELLLTEAGDVVEIRRSETFEDYVATVRWTPVPIRACGGGDTAIEPPVAAEGVAARAAPARSPRPPTS